MTPRIHMHILASGSKGNAIIVEGPAGCVLVDCGISRRSLVGRAAELGIDVGSIRSLIVTHEHSDHVKGISVFCNRFDGPLFATAGTVAARSYLSEQDFTLVGSDDEFETCGMHVKTFPTSHDVADPVGLRFTWEENGEVEDRVVLCTDTGYVTDRALAEIANARILAIESNHDERMLATGPYPSYLKQRIAGRGGHLSNAQAAEACAQLVGEDTEVVVAMHLSQENNRPSVCVRTLAEALGAEQANSTFTCARTPDGHLTILAAGQDRPMSVY